VIERKFFHYTDLEEWQCGMWAIVRGEKRKENAENAANLMRDSEAFFTAMIKAITEWPNSCLENLSNEASNRIAFLGHAGCCIGVGSPEENTRFGWHMLNKIEQDEANATALKALRIWIEQNSPKDLFSK